MELAVDFLEVDFKEPGRLPHNDLLKVEYKQTAGAPSFS
jgi:hypothetical protein